MIIGYCVPILPQLASFRLRVAFPALYTGYQYRIGGPGDVSFFFKRGNVALAESLMGPIVYDVVNDHFHDDHTEDYLAMCGLATVLTCASEAMARTVFANTGRHGAVIDDPYENLEQTPACEGETVLWFGHSANVASLATYALLPHLRVCSNLRGTIPWSLRAEGEELANCAVVLLTGSNHGASSNRLVKALRAGRFVVTPGGVESWDEFGEFCWIGNVQEGIAWALNNREEACRKVAAGQEWIRGRFSPQTIGRQWGELFASISARDTKLRKAG